MTKTDMKNEHDKLMERTARLELAMFGDENQKGQFDMTKEMYEIIVVTRGVATFMKWLAGIGAAYIALKTIGVTIFK